MISKESQNNFQELIRVCSHGEMCVVECSDSKDRKYQVICAVVDLPEFDEAVYVPFGFMLTPNIYNLLDRINPPESLKGEWAWPESTFYSS